MKAGNALRFVFFAAVTLAPASLLVFSDFAPFPYVGPKHLVFRAFVSLAAVCMGVLSIKERDFRPKISFGVGMIAVLLLVYAISDSLSEDPARSFFGGLERMDGWSNLFFMSVYAICVSVAAAAGKERVKLMTDLQIGVASILAVYGLLQFSGSVQTAGGQLRSDSLIGNPIFFGSYLAMMVFLALFMLFRERRDKERVASYSLFILVALAAMVGTGSRSSFAGVVAGLVIFGFALLRPIPGKWKTVAAGTAFLLIGAGAVFYSASVEWKDSPVSRIMSVSLRDPNDSSLRTRLALWNIALKSVAERPLVGGGHESFGNAFVRHYDVSLSNEERWFDRAHNVFLDIAVTGGVLALVSFVLLVAFSARCIAFSGIGYEEKAALLCLLIAYAVNGSFFFDSIASYSILFFVVGLSLSLSLQAAPIGRKSAIAGGSVVISLAAFFLVIDTFTFLRVGKVLSRDRLDVSDRPFPLGAYARMETARLYVEHATERAVFGRDEWSNAQNVRASNLIGMFDGDGDARFLFSAAQFYAANGDMDKAIFLFERVLSLSPDKQHVSYKLGLALLLDGRYQESYERLKKVFETAPRYTDSGKWYPDGAVMYAGLSILTGRQDEADAALKALFKRTDVPDARLATAYAIKGDYTREEMIARMMMKKWPDAPDAVFFLINSLVRQGKEREAQKALADFIKRSGIDRSDGELMLNEARIKITDWPR